jgi:hypothetical protein
MSHEALPLLDAAASLLRKTAPGLSGDERYATLLCANAIGTARRDIAVRDRCAAARAALPADAGSIRSGRHDGDAALYGRILAYVALRAWVNDPGTLTEAELAAHFGDEAG